MGVSKVNDGEPSNVDWRKMALRIQQETDPQKMTELVEQLISALDQERVRGKSAAKPQTDSPAA